MSFSNWPLSLVCKFWQKAATAKGCTYSSKSPAKRRSPRLPTHLDLPTAAYATCATSYTWDRDKRCCSQTFWPPTWYPSDSHHPCCYLIACCHFASFMRISCCLYFWLQGSHQTQPGWSQCLQVMAAVPPAVSLSAVLTHLWFQLLASCEHLSILNCSFRTVHFKSFVFIY